MDRPLVSIYSYIPSGLAIHLVEGMEKFGALSKVAGDFLTAGFNDFEIRSLYEDYHKIIQEIKSKLRVWSGSQEEMIMLVGRDTDVRIRGAAKEYGFTKPEFSSLMLCYGVSKCQR